MVKLVMGLKGTGKTKTLLDMIRRAVEEENGDVVCIEKGKDLTYDVPYTVRLIHASEYDIGSNETLRGFLSGIHAGNYDITHIFIDNFYKMLSDTSDEAVSAILDWLSDFGDRENVKFTISATVDPATVSESIKKYC